MQEPVESFVVACPPTFIGRTSKPNQLCKVCMTALPLALHGNRSRNKNPCQFHVRYTHHHTTGSTPVVRRSWLVWDVLHMDDFIIAVDF
jgi:hypothetical protein